MHQEEEEEELRYLLAKVKAAAKEDKVLNPRE